MILSLNTLSISIYVLNAITILGVNYSLKKRREYTIRSFIYKIKSIYKGIYRPGIDKGLFIQDILLLLSCILILAMIFLTNRGV